MISNYQAQLLLDPAFPLKPHLMQPYPGQDLSTQQHIFKDRLSRVHNVVENVFGKFCKLA